MYFGWQYRNSHNWITHKNLENIIVFYCYNHWKNHWDHQQETLNNAKKESKIYLVTGDFNLTCIQFYQSSELGQFFSNMFKKGDSPLINRPTRVTTCTSTLIDNIFINCVFDTSLQKGIIKFSISDHLATFEAIKISK